MDTNDLIGIENKLITNLKTGTFYNRHLFAGRILQKMAGQITKF